MIGQNIKQIREKQGYRQEDIAKLLHIKTSIINLWKKVTEFRLCSMF